MNDVTLAEYITALPKLPCGCTENHVGLCSEGLTLWEAVEAAWVEYRNGRMPSQVYYAAGRRFLAHFEDGCKPESATAPDEAVTEIVRVSECVLDKEAVANDDQK